MEDKHALVIGASSEIGRAIAVELAVLGMTLTLWGRDPHQLWETQDLCGGRARSLNVTDPAEVARAVADLPTRLAAVVYAAGAFDLSPADEADPAAWRRLLDVNLTAAATITPQVLPALLAAAPSSLVYIGSGAAHRAYPGNAAYVASKHGLAGLAEAVFLDVRDRDVKVSLISPGLVAAGAGALSPAGRERPEELLAPEDVAAAVRFVVTFPARGCPTQIRLQPQRSPG